MSAETFQSFACAECGGLVQMLPATGEKREFRRGIEIEIPRGTMIPKCGRCGEQYFSAVDAHRVDAAVREAYLKSQTALYQRCVEFLRQEHGIRLRDVERACGVTPTYFSHVMNGRRVASVTLTRLLEAFVACPDEFRRHLGVANASKRASGILHGPARSATQWAGSALDAARLSWTEADIFVTCEMSGAFYADVVQLEDENEKLRARVAELEAEVKCVRSILMTCKPPPCT